MCVGFSFSLNAKLNDQFKEEITKFEDDLVKNRL